MHTATSSGSSTVSFRVDLWVMMSQTQMGLNNKQAADLSRDLLLQFIDDSISHLNNAV
jgi:hypothetical protein